MQHRLYLTVRQTTRRHTLAHHQTSAHAEPPPPPPARHRHTPANTNGGHLRTLRYAAQVHCSDVRTARRGSMPVRCSTIHKGGESAPHICQTSAHASMSVLGSLLSEGGRLPSTCPGGVWDNALRCCCSPGSPGGGEVRRVTPPSSDEFQCSKTSLQRGHLQAVARLQGRRQGTAPN